MALIQVRDVPDHIYRLLVRQAEEGRRSIAQQVIAVLAKGLNVELDAKARRRKVLESIRSAPAQPRKLSNPSKLIHEDRRR